MTLPRLYAIVDRGTLAARGLAVGAFARELAAAGVGMVQYRDKVGSPQEVLQAAAEIEAAFAGRECLFVMNDRADLAALLGWGVHVGQGDLPPAHALRIVAAFAPHSSAKNADEWGTRRKRDLGVGDERGVLGATSHASAKSAEAWGTRRVVVGVSTHNEEQVLRLAALAQEDTSQGADYVAIGPVFATSTKSDAEPVVGLEGVRRARALTSQPLVAIGGITRENAPSVIEAGADAVAVIGGLFVEGMTVRASVEDFLERLR